MSKILNLVLALSRIAPEVSEVFVARRLFSHLTESDAFLWSSQ